ncbi:MAG: AAA family ATPase, partial [Gammaproteobacteria bacterium]|nr:AAA family ATPase [Gammaproteobacteria bacterium]
MHEWLAPCRTWLENTYRVALENASETTCEFRWVDGNELARETSPELAGALALADEEIGWLFFFLPYSPAQEPPIGHWINQALGLRARLAREANYTGKKEPAEGEDKDAWQVGLVWLLAETDDPAWQAEMATLRHESGASEELSFDRVLIAGNDVAAALDQHGLPRLLLASRQLLHKKADQAERWLSADAQVAEKLAGFSEQFGSPMARQHARWLEEQAAAHESAQVDISSAQRRFEGFAVENFRNLKSLGIAAASDEVGSIVLFGPNGTGKSSVIEALSLAAFHRSPRSDRYIKNETEEMRRDGKRYLGRYLAPLKDEAAQPVFRWGSQETQSFVVLEPDKAIGPEGIVLGQDESRELTQLSADELAAKVLRGYSELAQRLNDELDRRAESAKEDKQVFFRKHGLSSVITKSETAYDQLAREVLAQVKPVPSGFREWAERIATLRDEDAAEAGRLAHRWRQFQEMPA